MRISLKEFDPAGFSFHDDPLLVIEDFWSAEEMARFRGAMAGQSWTALHEMSQVRSTFANCGDWIKSDIQGAERDKLVARVLMPCVIDYVGSFEGTVGQVMSFHYYAYSVGDCLSVHDDTDSGEPGDPTRESVRRRLALSTYVHERWDPNWGGELITYQRNENGGLAVAGCVAPNPGSLVIFTVPRLHRVCRVDPLAGGNRRLSIAGWFMTRH